MAMVPTGAYWEAAAAWEGEDAAPELVEEAPFEPFEFVLPPEVPVALAAAKLPVDLSAHSSLSKRNF